MKFLSLILVLTFSIGSSAQGMKELEKTFDQKDQNSYDQRSQEFIQDVAQLIIRCPHRH